MGYFFPGSRILEFEPRRKSQTLHYRWKDRDDKAVIEFSEMKKSPFPLSVENGKGHNIDLEMTGKLLKKRILKAGLTVREVQSVLGLECPQSIYRWFKGQALPSVENMYVLHRLLGCGMEYLVVTGDRPVLLRCTAYFLAL